jgi:hypothetical protein
VSVRPSGYRISIVSPSTTRVTVTVASDPGVAAGVGEGVWVAVEGGVAVGVAVGVGDRV